MLKRILKLVFVLFIGFEILLRLYYAISITRTTINWHEEQGIGRRMTPNQSGLFVTSSKEYKTLVESNNEGWRDTNHTKEKPKDTYRIVVIGDSFVENFQVELEKTFFKQLEKNLMDKTGKKVEVVSLGLGDTGTAQQYNILKKYGLAYGPDLVVHIFFSGNDVKNNSPLLYGDPYRPYYKLENNTLVEIPYELRSSNALFRIKNFAKQHSRTVETILDTKGKLLAQQHDYPIDYQVYDPEYSPVYEEAWAVTKKLISETKNVSQSIGANYLLVSTANNEQVNRELQTKLEEKYSQFSDADLEKPDRIIREFCDSEDINCEFMLPYFRNYLNTNENEATHFMYDGHWNQTGTDLASEFLTEKVSNLFFNEVVLQN